MKELLLSYARYNAWANEQMLLVIRSLSSEQQEQEITSSFPSLRKTVLHLIDAESIWWQRIQLQEKILRPSENFEGDFEAVAAALQKIDQQWIEYVSRSNDHVFTHEFIYHDQKRVQHKQPTWQVLQHLFNHSTFHRGQLVTMLRQTGATQIPSTDFVAWVRK